MSAAATSDVIVIGAGIVGAACADALAAAGMSVTVVESGITGGAATAAGMGHLAALYGGAPELALTAYSLALWRELAAADPARHEYTECGTLWIAADERDMAAAHRKYAILTAHGIDAEMLDAEDLYAREPQLRPGLAGGLLAPADAAVYPPKSAAVLMERACRHGAQLVSGHVTKMTEQGVTLAGGTQLHADKVVVATGSMCTELLPELPIRAQKGHLVITDRYPGLIRHHLAELGQAASAHAAEGESLVFHLQPRPTGQLLIGASRQFEAAGADVEPRIVAQMLAHAARFVPALSALNALRCWTGVRAVSSDGLPLIGPHPERANIWLAVGHAGLGVTTALATAQLLTAQMLGKTTQIAVEPYLPARMLNKK
ncbi:MAG: binding domain protein [Herbaspirillum sp.]|nr:binding domain protein [Herbaspirillum sp.]